VLIIWGFRTAVTFLGIVTLTCANCHNPAAHRVEELVRRFTLFWIPLFTTQRRTLITCTFCGARGEVPKDEVAGLLAYAHGAPEPGPARQQALPQPGSDPRPDQV
jgi:hypothetical protein